MHKRISVMFNRTQPQRINLELLMQVIQEAFRIRLRDSQVLNDMRCSTDEMHDAVLEACAPHGVEEEAREAIPHVPCPAVCSHPEDAAVVPEYKVCEGMSSVSTVEVWRYVWEREVQWQVRQR